MRGMFWICSLLLFYLLLILLICFFVAVLSLAHLPNKCTTPLYACAVTASYRDEWDRTPLHHAAMHQAPQCAAVLMQHVKNKAKSELLKSQQNKSWGGCFLPFQRHNSSSEEFGIKSSNRVCAVHGFKPRSLRAPLPKGAKSPALKAEESFVDAQVRVNVLLSCRDIS